MKTHHLIGSMSNIAQWEQEGLFVSKNTKRITIPGCGGNETLLIDMLTTEAIPETKEKHVILYISETKELSTFSDKGYTTENIRIMSIYNQDEKAKLPDRQWMSVIINVSALSLLKKLIDSEMICTRSIQAA